MNYGMNMLLWTDDCTGAKFPALFERLRGMGYDSVEIPILKVEVRKLAALARTLDGAGLARTSATCLVADRNLIGEDRRQRRAGVEHLKRVIDASRQIGSPLLIGPIYSALGVFSGNPPSPREWAWAVEGLREAGEHAATAGVTLALEYLNRFEIYLLNCAADTARMVRDVDHPNVRMMYDTFHANMEEKSVAGAIDACRDLLVHVHVSENDRSTPGRGGVRWEDTWTALKKIGYRGRLVVEAFGQGLPGLAAATKIWRRMFEDEEKLAREALAFMKSSWDGPDQRGG